MRRVLVTGAPGFVGAAAVRALVEQGDEVIAVAQPGTLMARLHGLPVETAWVELTDRAAMRDALARLRPDVVLHAAWYAHPQDYLFSPSNLASLSATAELLRAAADCGSSRFVGVGTCLEYASSADARQEDGPCEPITLYASCKHAAWLAGRAHARQTKMSFAWARLFHLYGPDENPGRLLPAIVDAIRAGNPFPMTPGEQVRDYLHVVDAGRALAHLCRHEITGAVNIGTGIATPLRQFARMVETIVGGTSILKLGELPYRPDEEMYVVADISRLHETGFVPKYASLEDGLRAALQTWRIP